MPRGVVIPVSVPGTAQATQQLRDLANAQRAVAQGARQVNTAVAAGPQARYVAASQKLLNNPNNFDAQARFQVAQSGFLRAQQRINPGPPPSALSRFTSVLATSRFGAGGRLGGLQPLVGRTAAALGVDAEALGPLGLAAGALLGFTASVQRAAAAASEFGNARLMSGGTNAQIGALGAMGVPAGEIAGRAAALRERLSTDPYAMMFGGRVGLGPRLGRPFGNVNEAGDLQTGYQKLRNLRNNPDEQLRTARALDMDDQLNRLNVSDRYWNSQERSGRVSARVFDDRFQQDSRDFQSGMGTAGEGIKNVNGALIKGAVGFFANVARGYGDWLNDTAKTIEDDRSPQPRFFWRPRSADAHVTRDKDGRFRLSMPPAPGDASPGGKADPVKAATDKNTAAIQDLTVAIKTILNGGPRGTNAILPALENEQNREAMRVLGRDLRPFRY